MSDLGVLYANQANFAESIRAYVKAQSSNWAVLKLFASMNPEHPLVTHHYSVTEEGRVLWGIVGELYDNGYETATRWILYIDLETSEITKGGTNPRAPDEKVILIAGKGDLKALNATALITRISD